MHDQIPMPRNQTLFKTNRVANLSPPEISPISTNTEGLNNDAIINECNLEGFENHDKLSLVVNSRETTLD